MAGRLRAGLRIGGSGLAVGLCVGTALAQGAGQTIRVGMLGSSFAPATIQARVGDSLRFVNDDFEDHTVFVPTRGFGIDLGVLKPGGEAGFTVGRAGSFRVECVNHAKMLMTVEVRP